MTVKELKEILERVPEDAIVTYRHNEHGRIDVDKIDYRTETLLSGKKINILTLEARFTEEDL